MVKEMEVLETDVLVIGGGGAGCWAALKASEHDRDVTLINQYTFGKSGTTIVAMITYQALMGELGIHPEDDEDRFFDDLVRGGAYLGDQNLVEILVRNSRQTVLEYERLGVKWDKTGGRYDQKQLPGMSIPRGCFEDHRTGLSIQRALVKAVAKRPNIRYLERKALKLLKGDGRVAGVLAWDIPSGKFTKIMARSVVMATGGAGRLYRVTSMPEDARGGGMALALRAGAALTDVEFQLFFPTTLPYPESLKGLVVPRGTTVPLGARILNGKGERFMHLYYPEAEYATRDKSSIAIILEVQKGNGTPHGGVYMDFSRVEHLLEKYPTSFMDFKRAGVNLPEEWLEVCPGHHFSIGGIRINEFCETSLPGLYAAGEAAGNLHGANRVGGAALPECAVFGQIAGRYAAIHSTFKGRVEIPDEEVEEGVGRIHELRRRGEKGEYSPVKVMRELQQVMYDRVGVVRSEEGLREALDRIGTLKERVQGLRIHPGKSYNNQLVDAVDLQEMLLLGEAITRAALQRTESRGSHHRLDFPTEEDGKWRRHTLVLMKDDTLQFSTAPVVVTRER
jgi:fumarate reductase (CoM/CoB) subunit A